MARKWDDRYDDAKTKEFYTKVLELDPQGTAGTFTEERTKITAPYREFAELALAGQTMNSAKPDLAPLKSFLAKYPQSPLLKRAWQTMSRYYSYQAPKEEAAAFFPEYAAKFPDDANVLRTWMTRIIRDKGPAEKGLELADKIQNLTRLGAYPMLEQEIADLHMLKGDKDKAIDIFGKDFIADKLDMFAYNLVGYANFWLDKGENKDSAVAMAEKAMLIMPEDIYFVQQAASIYVKAGLEAKAMAIYGPAFLQKNIGEESKAYGYAAFWNRQGKNLDSAVTAAEKACALKPGTYYYWNTLASIYAKMKKWPEAVKAAEKAVETSKGPAREAMQKALDKIKQDAAKK